EGHVHHGGLVHNDGVHFQRVALVVGKDQSAVMGVELGLQQAVDGGALHAAQLAQAFGRPSGGGSQGGLQPQRIEEGQYAAERGGLAGARSAGEEHHLPVGGQRHRLPLLGGVDDAL